MLLSCGRISLIVHVSCTCHYRVELHAAQIKVNLFAEYLGKCCFLMSKGDLFVGGSIHQDCDQWCFEGKTMYFYESFCLFYRLRYERSSSSVARRTIIRPNEILKEKEQTPCV